MLFGWTWYNSSVFRFSSTIGEIHKRAQGRGDMARRTSKTANDNGALERATANKLIYENDVRIRLPRVVYAVVLK